MKEILEKAYYQHDVVCNQKYGNNLPYSFHLKAVVAQVEKYFDIIKLNKFKDPWVNFQSSERIKEILLRAAAGHDLIEDARMTYNDVKNLFGTEVADIIYCCTEEKGKNREERHSSKFFEDLKKNRLAVYVKLCDIMANVIFSFLTNSSMFHKYKNEFINLRHELYEAGEYEPLWVDLLTILNLH